MVNFLKENEIIYNLTIQDKNNPEIYNQLYSLIRSMFISKRCCHALYDIETIAYTLAGDMYLKIVNGAVFRHSTNYINKVYKRYLQNYYGGIEIVDTDAVESQLITTQYIPSSTEDLDDALTKIYLDDIYLVINELISEGPFKSGSLEFYYFNISVLLSLLYDDIILYHLDLIYKNLVKMATINFYEKLKEDLIP